MHRGVSVPNVDDPGALVDFAGELEAAGWDGYFLWDGHRHDADAGFATHDPWVLLGAVARATRRMRLGTGITPVPRRTPWKLAKEVVTLDHLSGGRAVLGVGLGAPDDVEFAAFGDHATRAERAARLDEALELVDLVLRGEPLDHDGVHYRAHAHLLPAAVQSPRPPIWVAATMPHQRPLERALRWDGVFCNWQPETEAPLTPAEVADYLGHVTGRDGFDVVTFRHPDHAPADYEAVGVDWLVEIPWPEGPTWLDEFRAQLADVAP
jgi:alkanesulfonate monooxygenase SsuD/methylene tetrahydromethanopterin reductase-like flavin-dependent oxidoreductase (luciferase family)